MIAYFPDAWAAISEVSVEGNRQHNGDNAPLHWDRSKSASHLDSAMRHMIDHSKGRPYDSDGTLHLAKAAWRLLAALQEEREAHR